MASSIKNSLDLLNAVKQQIKLEPKTYNQLEWCNSDGTKACGTQACVAGWIVAIHDGPRVLHVLNDLPDDPNYDDPLHGSPVARRAAQLLGLTTIDTYDLFSADVDTNSNPGTREYARAGVRRINQFISDYGDHLKYNYF